MEMSRPRCRSSIVSAVPRHVTPTLLGTPGLQNTAHRPTTRVSSSSGRGRGGRGRGEGGGGGHPRHTVSTTCERRPPAGQEEGITSHVTATARTPPPVAAAIIAKNQYGSPLDSLDYLDCLDWLDWMVDTLTDGRMD